jgi:hypothetical protein
VKSSESSCIYICTTPRGGHGATPETRESGDHVAGVGDTRALTRRSTGPGLPAAGVTGHTHALQSLHAEFTTGAGGLCDGCNMRGHPASQTLDGVTLAPSIPKRPKRP